MSRLLILSCLLLGCADSAEAGKNVQPSTTLAPTSAGMPASATLQVTVDEAGADYPLHLDGRHLGRAHLMIDTPGEPGTTSSFTLTLSKPDGTKLVDGWDVQISGPSVFVNLEWSPPGGTEVDVVLHVAAKTGSKSAKVAVGFFDPLE